MTATLQKFALQAGVAESKIDRDKGQMRDVSLIAFGPALGHGSFVDDTSLQTVLDSVDDDRLPAYITHRGAIFEDRLTREVGYFDNFRIENGRVLANFQAFDSFKDDESRRFNRLFELAETMPNRFGLSIVFSGRLAWATTQGDVEFDYDDTERPDNAIFVDPSIRVSEVNSADFVDQPAANAKGLFTKIDKPAKNMTKPELEQFVKELEKDKAELSASFASIETERDELSAKLETANKEIADGKTSGDQLSAKVTELEAEVTRLQSEASDALAKQKLAEDALAESTEKLTTLQAESETTVKALNAAKAEAAKLQKVIDGQSPLNSQPEGQDEGDQARVYSKDERNKIVSEFAKENGISEHIAVLKLGRLRPELWNR
jgi:hypothetical protein